MPVYIWDTSHYDGPLDRNRMARAKAEGIGAVTAKIAEGVSDTEGTHDDTTLAGARDAGIEFVGGYFVPRTLDSAAQVDRWWQLLNQGEPWWRDYPGWFNQIDLERWGYDNVAAAKGIDCAKRWRDKTGRWTILYASHGQYADQLAAWDGALWNADYVSRTAGSPAQMYPGDTWAPSHGSWHGGWAAYSGKQPTFLQFTSSATIAGLTTSDASAFRGSVADLRALITGNHNPTGATTMARTIDDLYNLIESELLGGAVDKSNALIWWLRTGADANDPLASNTANSFGPASTPGRKQLDAKLDQILAALATLKTGGVDTAALVSQIVAGVIAHHDKLTDEDAPVLEPVVEAAVRAVLHGA